MAQRTVVQMIDDLTGEELAEGTGETVGFGIDGQTYEIDLSAQNAQSFRDALAQYVAVSRRTSVGRGRAVPRRVASGVDNAAVRAWAASNGVQLNPRGRIPGRVIEQYRAAGN